MTDWSAGADAATRANRALLLRSIREFFHERDIMEVATPVLGRSGVTDVHIQSLVAHHGEQSWYLQTSPEYFMKRLLAIDGQPIYQMGPVFRAGETGGRHNTEFTMLEWYRPGYSLGKLCAEVTQLLLRLVDIFGARAGEVRDLRYRDLFMARWGENPHTADLETLKSLAASLPSEHLDDLATREDYLDLLFAEGVEAKLVTPTFVYHYPAGQAALAETAEDDRGAQVAMRFELIWRGVELANGYQELRDADELRRRMMRDNEMRRDRGLPEMPLDEKLLAALPNMPVCAGVALGIDRLLMLLVGKQSLDDVLDFADLRL